MWYFLSGLTLDLEEKITICCLLSRAKNICNATANIQGPIIHINEDRSLLRHLFLMQEGRAINSEVYVLVS